MSGWKVIVEATCAPFNKRYIGSRGTGCLFYTFDEYGRYMKSLQIRFGQFRKLSTAESRQYMIRVVENQRHVILLFGEDNPAVLKKATLIWPDSWVLPMYQAYAKDVLEQCEWDGVEFAHAVGFDLALKSVNGFLVVL